MRTRNPSLRCPRGLSDRSRAPRGGRARGPSRSTADPRGIPPRPACRDRGAVSILVVGFALIVLLLLGVVVSASRVYLAQRDLMAAADSAAASAAQAVSEAAVFGGQTGAELPLDQAAAQGRVNTYVTVADLPARFDGFAVVAVVVSGTSVSVTLAARAPMPFGTMLSSDWAEGYPVQATATARSPFS